MRNLLTLPIIIFLTIVTFFSKQCNAQYFAPVGAKWTYAYSSNGFGNPPPYNVEPLTIEVTKDTLINGLTCRKVEIAISSNVQNYEYIKSINDSVLVYSSVNNQFNLLYDFSANIGDTLQMYYNEDDLFIGSSFDSTFVIVDSIAIKNILGVNYRGYHQTCLVNISDCPERSTGWVIDSLGMIEYGDGFSYLFPAMNISGNVVDRLRCYTDSNTYYNYDNTNCDTSYIITDVNDISSTKINIYPTLLENNNRTITIETTNGFPEQIKLFSLTTITIPITLNQQKNKIKLTINKNLPIGIYLLSFKLNNIPVTKKIIIL